MKVFIMKLAIAIGADHRGYAMKKYLIEQKILADYHIDWTDVGTYSTERTDYPIYAKKVAELVQEKKVQYGILLCGTGTGMEIAANRFKGVYAGLAWNTTIARLNKEDDNCNVLILPSDYISNTESSEILIAWLIAEFKKGRYAERIAIIDTY